MGQWGKGQLGMGQYGMGLCRMGHGVLGMGQWGMGDRTSRKFIPYQDCISFFLATEREKSIVAMTAFSLCFAIYFFLSD